MFKISLLELVSKRLTFSSFLETFKFQMYISFYHFIYYFTKYLQYVMVSCDQKGLIQGDTLGDDGTFRRQG